MNLDFWATTDKIGNKIILAQSDIKSIEDSNLADKVLTNCEVRIIGSVDNTGHK